MYLQLNKKKIKIKTLSTFMERFKGLKFVLEPIDYGVFFPHKKFVTTNFLCQRIDIVLTDKKNKILYLYEDFPSERYIYPKRKVRNVYFLPLHTAKYLEIGTTLNIKEEKSK